MLDRPIGVTAIDMESCACGTVDGQGVMSAQSVSFSLNVPEAKLH